MESTWGDLAAKPERIPSVLQPEPRNERTAFGLSLLLPGAGQWYCGERSRGGWTMVFFIASATAIAMPWVLPPGKWPEAIWGVAVRSAVVLYGFAFLDAYFTARETSEGIWPLQPYQPRLAATLNLLTRGFGYWHVGDRKKGFATFFGLYLVASAAHASVIVSYLVEAVVAALAIHAYRLAESKNREAVGTIDPVSVVEARILLPEAVPMGLGFVIGCLYVALQLSILTMPDYSSIHQEEARVDNVASGALIYRNPRYGVSMTVPEGWSLETGNPKTFVRAGWLTGGCQVEFMPVGLHPIVSPKQIAANTLAAYINAKIGWEAGAYKFELLIPQEGLPAHQTIHLFRRGFTAYATIVTDLQEVKQSCQTDARSIRESLVLP